MQLVPQFGDAYKPSRPTAPPRETLPGLARWAFDSLRTSGNYVVPTVKDCGVGQMSKATLRREELNCNAILGSTLADLRKDVGVLADALG